MPANRLGAILCARKSTLLRWLVEPEGRCRRRRCFNHLVLRFERLVHWPRPKFQTLFYCRGNYPINPARFLTNRAFLPGLALIP